MKMKLKQIIPQEYCLKCEGCCHFIDEKSQWIPQITDSEALEAVKKGVPAGVFSKTDKNNHHLAVIKKNDATICDFLSLETNKCQVYSARPFDCQIYPFILDKRAGKIVLGLHLLCPFVKENFRKKEFQEYLKYFKEFINKKATLYFIKKNAFLVGHYEKFRSQLETICVLK